MRQLPRGRTPPSPWIAYEQSAITVLCALRSITMRPSTTGLERLELGRYV